MGATKVGIGLWVATQKDYSSIAPSSSFFQATSQSFHDYPTKGEVPIVKVMDHLQLQVPYLGALESMNEKLED